MAAGPRLLREILRFLRTAGTRRHGRQVVRPLPPRRGLLGVVPVALPRSDDVRALVDGTTGGTRVSRLVRDRVLPEPLDARPAPEPLANRHRRQPRVRARRCSSGSAPPVHLGRRVALAAAHGRRGGASHRRRHDAQLRRRRRRNERAAGAGAARGSLGRRAGDPARAFESTANETVLHTDAAPPAATSLEPLVVELPVAGLRRLTPTGPSITYSLNRLQRLDAPARVLRHAQPHRRHRSRAR